MNVGIVHNICAIGNTGISKIRAIKCDRLGHKLCIIGGAGFSITMAFLSGMATDSVIIDTPLAEKCRRIERTLIDEFQVNIDDLKQSNNISGRPAIERVFIWDKILDSLKVDKATKDAFKNGVAEGLKKSVEQNQKIISKLNAIK